MLCELPGSWKVKELRTWLWKEKNVWWNWEVSNVSLASSGNEGVRKAFHRDSSEILWTMCWTKLILFTSLQCFLLTYSMTYDILASFMFFMVKDSIAGLAIYCLCLVCILLYAVPINPMDTVEYSTHPYQMCVIVCATVWTNPEIIPFYCHLSRHTLSLPCQFIHEVVGAVWESNEQSFGLIKGEEIKINKCYWRNHGVTCC